MTGIASTSMNPATLRWLTELTAQCQMGHRQPDIIGNNFGDWREILTVTGNGRGTRLTIFPDGREQLSEWL